ncbi:Charged multivesicular body protein 6 [Lamellibrachia satsuma]|nr:Charged multivesicular body protein 6 [Lamellibrachia satsuma]
MGNLFFKRKKESRVTEQDRAVLQLKQQRDKMQQYQKKTESQLEQLRQVAKQLLAKGQPGKAKLLLRKKKYQETLLIKTGQQLDNIEKMVHDLEFAQLEMTVMDGLKSGNEALKKLHQILSVEDVEKILDETTEAVEYQQEIDALLAGGLTQEDEADVLNELDQILLETSPAVPTMVEDKPINLPDVPQDKIREKTPERIAVAAT